MESNQVLNLSSSDLRRAAGIKERIEELNNELASILGGAGSGVAERKPSGRGRKMSAEGRARIAAAARARWARVRGEKAPADGNAGTGKKRRTMSLAARKKIAEAAKARWAKIRAAKGKA